MNAGAVTRGVRSFRLWPFRALPTAHPPSCSVKLSSKRKGIAQIADVKIKARQESLWACTDPGRSSPRASGVQPEGAPAPAQRIGDKTQRKAGWSRVPFPGGGSWALSRRGRRAGDVSQVGKLEQMSQSSLRQRRWERRRVHGNSALNVGGAGGSQQRQLGCKERASGACGAPASLEPS
ncbi:hypothetical protein J1605_008329 [Eschrichtius robustus]|uniref:Uncharacterized protein n=1 Tax=Eschrichtius robustus TaxID=9764 RepID=A0AB34H0Y3_ESCRO|nr:hypothetical protein J1605_008329 [Eschrichtius robustus]